MKTYLNINSIQDKSIPASKLEDNFLKEADVMPTLIKHDKEISNINEKILELDVTDLSVLTKQVENNTNNLETLTKSVTEQDTKISNLEQRLIIKVIK